MNPGARRTATRVALASVLVLACSDLPTSGSGVVALEVELPNPAVIETNDTLTLVARALNANGDEVAVPISWRTPDTTLTLDSAGRVSTTLTSGIGRVQAQVGSLRSGLATLTIRPRSDTVVIVPPDTLDVLAGATASGPLEAQVQSLNPAGGVSGTSIVYQVVDSAATAAQLVRFANGGQLFRAATGTTGGPSTPVTLSRIASTTVLEARVRVDAFRPSGAVVPGSGQEFLVRFQ